VRLSSLSTNGRLDLWRVALRDAAAHPLLGSGAGTFGLYWLGHRNSGPAALDAHNLYLETLAETGPIGLAVVAIFLGLPLLAALRARRRRFVAAAAAGYCTFLAHAALDWDWELPAVTLAGLLCGVCLLVASRRGRRPAAPRLAVRAAVAAALVAPAGFAYVALIGNRALDSASAAADQGQWAKVAHEARRAVDWTPWSSSGWQLLSRAQRVAGDRTAGRASLRKAVANDPHDWTLWFELATLTSGSERRHALARAAQLNPGASLPTR
jgi:hypothetical protein